MSKPTPIPTITVAGKVREVAVLTAPTSKVPMPERSSNRGQKSIYDFSVRTEVGMSFGVKNKTREQVSSVVSRENKRNRIDAATHGKTHATRFEVFTVDPKTDPDKAMVRVFRVE